MLRAREATIEQQQTQIEAVASGLETVNDKLEMSRLVPQRAVNS
jgi:hypothetical protein